MALLSEKFAAANAFGKWCSAIHANGTAGYAGTVAVAQDMLHYTKLRAKSRGKDTYMAKLNFYGGSYVTVLGATFVNLYLDRVGKMVLNGVVAVEDWYKGDRMTGLQQMDSTVETFFTSCYAAGSNCVFNKNATSAAEIKARFDAILVDLEKNPVSYYDPNVVQYPVIVTDRGLDGLIVQSTYSSIELFTLLTVIMVSLEQRNAKALVMAQRLGQMPDLKCDNEQSEEKQASKSLREYDNTSAFFIIKCMDAGGSYNISSMQEYRNSVNNGVGLSKYGGDSYAAQGPVMYCSLNLQTPEIQIFKGLISSLATANLILLVGNRFDPVTPAAHNMHTFFKDSVALSANTTGHCAESMPNASVCMHAYVARFWEKGEMPPPDTVCEVEKDFVPFTNTKLKEESLEAALGRTELLGARS